MLGGVIAAGIIAILFGLIFIGIGMPHVSAQGPSGQYGWSFIGGGAFGMLIGILCIVAVLKR